MTVPFSITGGSNHVSYGEITFNSQYQGAGLITTWTVPVGVTSISAVCVGGGGGANLISAGGGGGGGALAYVNNISVTPGETLTIYAGSAGDSTPTNGGISSIRNAAGTTLVAAGGGVNGNGTRAGGTVLTGTGFAGGAGGAVGGGGRPGGGGGAGGWGGVGGAGGAGAAGGNNGTAGTGGAGGGGWGSSSSGINAGSGGGVFVGIGSGTSGFGGDDAVSPNTPAGGCGSSPLSLSSGLGPGSGSGSGPNAGYSPGAGAGVVKIVWNAPTGPARTFPSTRVIDTTDFQVVPISGTTSSATTIQIPTGIQAGDIAILFDAAGNSSATIPTSVTPSGWTLIDSASASNVAAADAVRSNCSYKVLVSGDSGATITGMTSGDVITKTLVIVRPNQPIMSANSVSFSVSTPATQGTTGANPTNQTISMSTLNATKDQAILYFAHYRAGRGATIGTAGATGALFLPITNSPGNGDQEVQYGDFTASETPTNATISMSSSGADFQVLQSFYLLFDIN